MYNKDDYVIVFNEPVNNMKTYKDAKESGYCLARVVEKVDKILVAKAVEDYQERKLLYTNIKIDINNAIPIDNLASIKGAVKNYFENNKA